MAFQVWENATPTSRHPLPERLLNEHMDQNGSGVPYALQCGEAPPLSSSANLRRRASALAGGTMLLTSPP